MEIPDAQCHPFRHRRADGGRSNHAGGDAARRRLAHASRATRSASISPIELLQQDSDLPGQLLQSLPMVY
jgi:hypothetical protein